MLSKLLLVISLASTISCQQNTNSKKLITHANGELLPNPEGNKKDSTMLAAYDSAKDKFHFKKYLKDPRTPLLAKNIFYNKWQLNDDEPLTLLNKLYADDMDARPFYFRVITNSYSKADGAYSEGLGNAGYEYIKNNVAEFTNYFTEADGFTDNDLRTWAKIVLLEIKLDYDNTEYDKYLLIKNYVQAVEKNCNNCKQAQLNVLNKFEYYLQESWTEYLKTLW